MMPDCPHAVPSLDDPAGWYCTAGCKGNCHKGGDSAAIAENDDLAEVSSPAPGQLRDGDRQPRPEQLSHGDLPLFALDDGPALAPGQVVWKECTYYGVTGWHPFTIIDHELASCRSSVIVEGQVKEICDTVIINQGFKEAIQPAPPKPAAGATIAYEGAAVVVYNSGTTEGSIWLMQPGGTVANAYPWPPTPIEEGAIAAPAEVTPESAFDSAYPRHFSDSTADDVAIAPDFDSSFDSSFDSAYPRRCGDLWMESGPYKTSGITYYRYRWGRGHKIEGVRHIPGGALTRLVVANRAYRVHQAVHVEGRSHTEVLAIIDGWRKPRARRR